MIETEREEQPVRVQIVVAAGYAFEESRTIDMEMREILSLLRVDLIALDGGRPTLDWVAATPTYLLDGDLAQQPA
ncbi:MAG: hypothetical protein WKH64_18500 [Chloroflexia bacterium]